MRSWDYIQKATLAKLDLTREEAESVDLLSRFIYYANEAMSQICSTVKPNRTYAQFKVVDKITDDIEVNEDITLVEVRDIVNMPNDFVSFNDDLCTRVWTDDCDNTFEDECHDDELRYMGYNKIKFYKTGVYTISYNARWHTFSILDDENNYDLDIPDDIVDCLPSYITSQCYKVDDEVKSSIYRNEYEMLVARIDNTEYKQPTTLKIGGNW